MSLKKVQKPPAVTHGKTAETTCQGRNVQAGAT